MAKERLELTQLAGGITSWEWDLETDLMTWTAGRSNLIRLGAQETMKYSDVVNAIHPDDREATRLAARRAVDENETYMAEFRVVQPDGTIRSILSRGKVFHDETGKPIRMLGVNMDITDRKRVETALIASEERFRATFERAAVGIAHLMPDGRFAITNQMFCAIFGYTAEELAQKAIRDVVHADDYPAMIESRDRLYAGVVASYTHERRYVRKDGSIFVGETTASVVRDDDGKVKYVIVILTDVTKMRLVAAEMKRALDAAAAANLAKTRFLANVSHEMRTPLTAILGFSELLRAPMIDEAKRRHCLGVIERNGTALKTLIDDLLDLSKIEAGQLDVETAPISLKTLLDEVEAVQGRHAASKGLELSIRREGRIPEVVDTDGLRLKQILSNLIGNAVKFTERGRVEVLVSARPAATKDALLLVFTISDTGIGIDPEQKARLFAAFSQADATMARKFGGTGLGLVLSRHLARLLGGDVVLQDSSPGLGSTFVATIAVNSSDRKHGEVEEPVGTSLREIAELAKLRGARVLLVEDSEETRTFLSEVLRLAGASVDLAVNGLEALEAAERGGHDVVLMDIQMPELDGFAATGELRRRGFRKPIIAVSAHAFESERHRCLEQGFNGFISKPVQSVQLIETVAQFLKLR